MRNLSAYYRGASLGVSLLLPVLSAPVAAEPPAFSPAGPPREISDGIRLPESFELRRILRKVRAQTGVPALAAAVFTTDGITADAIGVRYVDQSETVTTVDRFQLGSCTKAMTAALAARLVEMGKIRWHTTLEEAFPTLHDRIDPSLRGVTLRHLLSHRSGLVGYTDFSLNENGKLIDTETGIPYPDVTGTPRQQRQQFAAFILTRPASFPFGNYHYSNAGYAIAAAMLENAADDSWEYLSKKLIFDPLRVRPGIGLPGRTDPNQPWGHFEADGDFLPQDPNNTDDPTDFLLSNLTGPAGGICLSIDDYARYAQMHLRGLLGKPTLLRPASVAFLHTPVGGPIDSQGDRYALGWVETNIGGVKTYYHDGSAGSYLSLMVLQPSRGIGAVIVCNAGGDRALRADNAALAALLSFSPPASLRRSDLSFRVPQKGAYR